MKLELLNHCLSLAESKVDSLELELASMRNDVQNESKSTAGDKHETGRAMIHLEQEKLHQQLAEAKLILTELQQIKPERSGKINLGSLVKTNRGSFFFAASLGKVEFDNESVFVVSTKAPIANQFIGKQIGEKAQMNGTVYDILAVE